MKKGKQPLSPYTSNANETKNKRETLKMCNGAAWKARVERGTKTEP